jgi:hypothetical protein
VTRAYRVPVPVFGGGPEATEGLRSRVARGRPNWWVILAVSLGLMALLVATAGSTPPAPRRAGGEAQSAARIPPRAGRAGAAPLTPTTRTPTTTTTTTGAAGAPLSGATDLASSARTTETSGAAGAPPAATAAPSVTTTTLAPATTTTTAAAGPSSSVAADRTQTQGYLNPPLQSSNQFGFTGTGAMEISVVWSGDTYLSMEVSCPSGDQNVGGTSAMAASLPDASGSCLATVSEPTSESTSLTYTITIGPAGG